MFKLARFKEMLFNMGYVLVAISTILGILLIYAGLKYGVGMGRKIFLILGPLLLIPAIILFFKESFENNKKAKKYEEELNKFKNSATKIIVDLSTTNIKSNKWTEKEITDSPKHGQFKQIFKEGEAFSQEVEVYDNLVELTIPYKGDTIHYQFSSAKDTTTLKMLLEMKKQTTLYIDPEENGRIYLDLEFLEA